METIETTSPATDAPATQDTLAQMHQPGQPTASRVVEATLEQGPPPPRAAGGSTGRSQDEPIFEKVRALKPGEGWVKVPTAGRLKKDGTPFEPKEVLAHLRTSLKRQGKFPKDVKATLSADRSFIQVWIPALPKGPEAPKPADQNV